MAAHQQEHPTPAIALSIPVYAKKNVLSTLDKDVDVKTTTSTASAHAQVSQDGAAQTKAQNAASGNEARVLTLAECYKEASYALAEAFKDDHSSKYFTHTPDRAHWSEEQRWELHVKLMEYITYAHLLKGLVVSAGPNYDCVALWMPPGHNMDDYLTILRSGMWRLNYLLSSEGRRRFFSEFLPLLNDTKAQVMGSRDQDSWYLVYIGTRPSGRGKGYARKVIDFVTDMADKEGKACYLESSNEVNLKIYGRMGFKLRKNVYLQREVKQIQLDIMVREPRDVRSDADSGIDVK